jgi:hypothetical protein
MKSINARSNVNICVQYVNIVLCATGQTEKGEKMDAVEFLKKFDRMCTTNASLLACDKCKASDCCLYGKSANPEKLVEVVEEWTKEHQVKTRQSEFLRLYPRADKDINGVLALCPKYLDIKNDKCASYTACTYCRKDYWLTEI